MSENILAKVKSYYEGAKLSKPYIAWQNEATEAWNFYDGVQWSEEEIQKLTENGQPAIVINKLASKIDNIAGSEILGRTRILYRSRSGEKSEEETARALSDLALYVAENTDQSLELSSLFKEGLVSGIAWLDVGVEEGLEGVRLFNRYEDSKNVVWDPAFTRADYSDARFVCRERFLDEETFKTMFPNSHEKALSMFSHSGNTFGGSGHFLSDEKGKDLSYTNALNKTIRVVEVQYKQTEKSYKITTPEGETLHTFDKAVAYANAKNMVETSYLPRVYIAYFTGDFLLENTALPYKFNNFTLIPYIFKRHKSDGRPYGLLRAVIDSQRELNKRRSKAMHLLSTSQVIADIDAVEDPNILAREAARPDGIILKRPGKDLRIIRNADLAASQVSVMEQASRDIQEVIGLFDESIGKHSNATSGIAIHQRQRASAMNQMFAFDALRRTKKALGERILSLVRQFFTAHMVLQITDDISAMKKVQLNVPVTDENGNVMTDANTGKVLKYNDISTGVFDIVVEEFRDVLTSRERELSELTELMAAGVPVPASVLVEASSIRNKNEILQGLTASQTQNDEGK